MLKGRSDIQFGRRRLEELREKRRPSVDEAIKNSRTTAIINITIEVISGILFMTGLVYAVRFLNIRRSLMEDIHYKMLLWSIVTIGGAWFVWLMIRMRRNLKRYFELQTMAEEHAAKADKVPE